MFYIIFLLDKVLSFYVKWASLRIRLCKISIQLNLYNHIINSSNWITNLKCEEVVFNDSKDKEKYQNLV